MSHSALFCQFKLLTREELDSSLPEQKHQCHLLVASEKTVVSYQHQCFFISSSQVEVVAEADPERMMADTEAWRSRHLNEKEFELQRPLYSINTYTDKQVRNDNIYPPLTFTCCLKDANDRVHYHLLQSACFRSLYIDFRQSLFSP